MSQSISLPGHQSAFDVSDPVAYSQWRVGRVSLPPVDASALFVDVDDPYSLSDKEIRAITDLCRQYNMAIYQLNAHDVQEKTLVHALGRQLGLQSMDSNLRADNDGVSSLEVRKQTGNQYIPYTNKALSWHTDGYYNPLDKQIFGIIMHCVSPADEGGINRLVNPEQIYIALRDENPAFITALMHPQAMTIPENVDNGKVLRPAQTGPVFMVKPDGRLHMRFSARKRNIIWRDTPETGQAVAMINHLLADDQHVVRVRLRSGQGIICNNVLHNRSGFTDSESHRRLMYRARYYDAVRGC